MKTPLTGSPKIMSHPLSLMSLRSKNGKFSQSLLYLRDWTLFCKVIGKQSLPRDFWESCSWWIKLSQAILDRLSSTLLLSASHTNTSSAAAIIILYRGRKGQDCCKVAGPDIFATELMPVVAFFQVSCHVRRVNSYLFKTHIGGPTMAQWFRPQLWLGFSP